MKIIKITKVAKKKKDCGGYGKPKGHLDTQLFPECAGTDKDRNIAKKERKRKKASDENITVESKKKKWNPNPWAICHETVDKDKDPEKFERCVKKVKKNQK